MRNIKAFRFFSTLFDCRSVNWTLDGSRSTVCLIQGFLNEYVWIHKHPSVFLQELFSVRHQSNKSQRTMSCAVSVTRSASYITHIWTLGRKQMDWFLWVLVKHSHCTHTHTRAFESRWDRNTLDCLDTSHWGRVKRNAHTHTHTHTHTLWKTHTEWVTAAVFRCLLSALTNVDLHHVKNLRSHRLHFCISSSFWWVRNHLGLAQRLWHCN